MIPLCNKGDMLAHPELPPGLLAPCLDVLKEIMPSERDLIRVVVEIIIELREDDEDPENHDNRSTVVRNIQPFSLCD